MALKKLRQTGTKKRSERGGKKKRKGHGRNAASKYIGAEVIFVPIENMKAGNECPECERGKAYKWKPKVIVCIRGHPPISATLYELECLRCNTCGAIFTATLPEGLSGEKYDATASATIGLLKYGYGIPLKRLEMVQDNMGIPLPVATQWQIIDAGGKKMAPVYWELVRLAAQGQLVQNDDTPMKILDLKLPDGLCDPEEKDWFEKQFKEKLVEPNSSLGKAINYMLKRWDKLTLFLRRPGVPLDNNIVERSLKRVILVRKNSLFFKTLHGAEIGDIYMSLFQTCRLAGVNAFDYFVALQRHAEEVERCPADWLPWNYADTLKSLTASN